MGDRVVHQKFGEGTVKEIEDGARDYQVTVAVFASGERWLEIASHGANELEFVVLAAEEGTVFLDRFKQPPYPF